MKKQFRYASVFLYSSLQFIGNIEQYFLTHTEHLVCFLVMPRVGSAQHVIREYRHGKMVSEKSVGLAKNIVLYYAIWYWHHVRILLSYFRKGERPIIVTFHPLAMFGMIFQRLLKGVRFAYWIGDYYPPVRFSLIAFEKLKSYYHAFSDYTFYLSDTINKIMNGKVVNSISKRTVMWGTNYQHTKTKGSKKTFTLLFVGLVKRGQGIETIFSFLSKHPDIHIKIIGVCPDELYKKYQDLIRKLKIERQVFFPNRFYEDVQLKKEATACHAGIALYDTSADSATYYTDPGKIKTYAELGLPIIMSDTSAIAPFVRRFNCGEIVTAESQISKKILRIKDSYAKYQKGLFEFNEHFHYETYYHKAFQALEK